MPFKKKTTPAITAPTSTKTRDVVKGARDNKLAFTGHEIAIAHKIRRLQTGILDFDIKTNGGIPLGYWTMLWGMKTSGKSSLCYRIIGKYLSQHPDKIAVFADFEHGFDYEWASKCIDDMARLIVLRPDYGEQGIDMLVEVFKGSDLGLVVVDSIAMMIPAEEVTKKAHEDTMGLQPKVVNKLIRKLTVLRNVAARAGQQVTIILTNQIRATIQVAGGARPAWADRYTRPGGNLKEHTASLEVQLYRSGFEPDAKLNIPIRSKHRFWVIKDRHGLDGRDGTYEIRLVGPHKGTVYDEVLYLSYAKAAGLLKREGNVWNYKGTKFRTQEEFNAKIESDPKFKAEVHQSLLSAFLGDVTLAGGHGED